MINVRRPTRSDNIPARIVISALMACCALQSNVNPINGTPDCDNCSNKNASEEFPSAKTELMTKYFLSAAGSLAVGRSGTPGTLGTLGNLDPQPSRVREAAL